MTFQGASWWKGERPATTPSRWLLAFTRTGIDAVRPLDASTVSVKSSLEATRYAGARSESDMVIESHDVRAQQICAVMDGGRESLEKRTRRIMGGARDV